MAAAKKASRKTTAAVGVAEAGVATLAEIVAATLDEKRGFLYTLPAVHIPLIEAGLVEINTQMTNNAGEIATRATEKGVQQVNTVNTQEQTSAPAGAVEIKGFKLEANVPVPGIIGRGRSGATVYPFEAMEVGHSFFVANSEDKPNAAKSLASTVSSATARYAVEKKDEAGNVVMRKTRNGNEVPEMIETRKFIVRSVEENGVKGARVWRTA